MLPLTGPRAWLLAWLFATAALGCDRTIPIGLDQSGGSADGGTDGAGDAGGSTGRWVVGYYPYWQRDLYPLDRVDFGALTHLAAVAVAPNDDGSLDVPDPDGSGTNQWACDMASAAHAAGRKAIVVVGGAGTLAAYRSAAAPANRARFVQSLVDFAMKPPAAGGCGFDGLDLFWEVVDVGGGDGALVEALATDLRAAWPGVILTLPAPWETGDPWYGSAAHLFDLVHVRTFAMAGAWGGWVSWHEAALYGEAPDHPSSVSSAMSEFLAAGVPASKLGFELGFFGSVWSGGSPPVTGPLQPIASGVTCDPSNEWLNTYGYIMDNYYTAAAYQWDDVAKMGSLSYPSGYGPGNATWVSYEDERSIAEKGAYAKANGLGGVMLWNIAEGCIDPATGAHPLLGAVRTAFLP